MSKTLFIFFTAVVCGAQAATTVNPANNYAYGANIGWMNWHGDTNNGVVIGEFVCAGYIYAANAGWIHLGDGSPANGIRYQNDSSNDFGLNHDGAGNLRGFAYGANIGWLNFTNRDATGAAFDGPKVNLVTGRLSGFVWSANCGWVSLSNAFAHVQTDRQESGPDTDNDGIPDDWERARSGDLTTLTGSGDNDSDGHSNAEEYLADTSPLDLNSRLRITSYSASAGGSTSTIAWASSPARVYRLLKTNNVAAPLPWPDTGLGLMSPSAGPTTSRTSTESPSSARFFVIEALKPLR